MDLEAATRQCHVGDLPLARLLGGRDDCTLDRSADLLVLAAADPASDTAGAIRNHRSDVARVWGAAVRRSRPEASQGGTEVSGFRVPAGLPDEDQLVGSADLPGRPPIRGLGDGSHEPAALDL